MMTTTYELPSPVDLQLEQPTAPVDPVYQAPPQQLDTVIGFAHDLGNSLGIVNAASWLLAPLVQQLPLESQPTAHMLLALIETHSAQMKRLLAAMQEAENPLSPSAEPQPALTDMVELVRSVVAKHTHPAHPNQIRFETDTASIVGTWQPLHIERIVGNLLANATKYSHDASSITVALTYGYEQGTPWVVLTVSDQGTGISRHDLPNIFEDGYRGSNATNGVEGNGHGLAIVRRLVEASGGTVEVTSVEGVGSIFTVRLPVG